MIITHCYECFEKVGNTFALIHAIFLLKIILNSVERRYLSLCPPPPLPQGFLVFHSYGGGAGGGLASLAAEYLAMEYPKCRDVRIPVMPSGGVSGLLV